MRGMTLWSGAESGRILIALLLLGLVAATGLAHEARVTVELLVPPIQTLRVDPIVLDLPTPSATDLNRGYIEFGRPAQARVRSNTPWQLAIRLGLSSANGSGKAIAKPRNLQWTTERGEICDVGREWTIVAGGPACAEQVTVELPFRVPATWTTMPPGDEEWRIDYQLLPAEGVHLARSGR